MSVCANFATSAVSRASACAACESGVPSLNFAFLGRWIGHLPEGQWVQRNISKATPVRGEMLIGWSAHYGIGVTFSALLLSTSGLQWARSPSLIPALVVGVVTVLAPQVAPLLPEETARAVLTWNGVDTIQFKLAREAQPLAAGTLKVRVADA